MERKNHGGSSVHRGAVTGQSVSKEQRHIVPCLLRTVLQWRSKLLVGENGNSQVQSKAIVILPCSLSNSFPSFSAFPSFSPLSCSLFVLLFPLVDQAHRCLCSFGKQLDNEAGGRLDHQIRWLGNWDPCWPIPAIWHDPSSDRFPKLAMYVMPGYSSCSRVSIGMSSSWSCIPEVSPAGYPVRSSPIP